VLTLLQLQGHGCRSRATTTPPQTPSSTASLLPRITRGALSTWTRRRQRSTAQRSSHRQASCPTATSRPSCRPASSPRRRHPLPAGCPGLRSVHRRATLGRPGRRDHPARGLTGDTPVAVRVIVPTVRRLIVWDPPPPCIYANVAYTAATFPAAERYNFILNYVYLYSPYIW